MFGPHQAHAVFETDFLDFLLPFVIARLGEARWDQDSARDFLFADFDQRLRDELGGIANTATSIGPGTSLTLLYAFSPMISSAEGLIG